jgi:hypothetical protein
MRGLKNREQGKWKKMALFGVLFLTFVFLSNSVHNVYKKKKAAGEALTRMEQEKTKLEERDRYLKESLARLSTSEGMGFEARKKLNIAEAGESVAIIVDQVASTSDESGTSSTWQKIKNLFSNLFK